MIHLIEALSSLDSFFDLPWYYALSGGIDSVVLLHAINQRYPGKIHLIIHINHQLQAKAPLWEEQCKLLAAHYQLPFICHRLDLPSSSEDAARRGRYRVFEDYLNEPGILLMAHHLDDNIETVLWRFLRGSPLQALIGMRPKRQLNKGWIVRPFLGISKMMIQEYAIEHHLVWCIDPTNEEIDYTRNYLRNSLIPQLEERFLSVKKQIIKTQTFCSYSQEAMLHWMEPYFISKTQLAWSEYPDQSKAGLFTLISTWLNFFHYEHPSLKAVECFIEQLLSGKGGQLCIQDKTLLNYNGRLFVESTSDLLRDPPEKKKIFFESGLIKWGIYHVVHKQDFLPQLIEIRRLNKNDTLVLPNRKKIKAQNFWNQYNIPPWKRKWLPAIFSEKIFLQYYTYCYNGELFQEQPFDIS